MSAEHTPGPWTFSDGDGYEPWLVVANVDGKDVLVAKVLGDSAEAWSNGELIARAPDAAAEITALRERVAVLETALQPFAAHDFDAPPRLPDDQCFHVSSRGTRFVLMVSHFRRARAALEASR